MIVNEWFVKECKELEIWTPTLIEMLKTVDGNLLKLNCDKAIFHLEWSATMGYKEIVKFTSDWYNHYFSGTIDMLDFVSAKRTAVGRHRSPRRRNFKLRPLGSISAFG